MKILEIDSLTAPGGEVAVFHGFEHEASLSFFIVRFSPGMGPKKHRRTSSRFVPKQTC